VALNFSTLVYLPNFDLFARPITVTPQGGSAYSDMRGILDTESTDVIGLDGQSVIADQKTFIDIRAAEFSSAGHPIPEQADVISIPAVDDLDDEGDWEVVSSAHNGGGEVTLVIRKLVTPAP
jgi:hypothetical protein